MQRFFSKIIENRWYIIFLFLLIIACGIYSINHIKIDAIPDITNKQVVINTKTFGMEPSRIEKSITYPIEAELFGIQGLIEMRSISKFGLSQITLIFNDKTDIYFARNLVLQRLSTIASQLPPELKPEIAPLTTGIGEILIYRVVKKPNNIQPENQNISSNLNEKQQELMELRTIQQFEISRFLKKIQGVAEVDTIGGFERELHLNIDPTKIKNFGLTPEKIINHIKTIGENFGGGYIEQDNQQKIVRTFSNIKNFDDIMNVPVKLDYSGKFIPLKHVVEVRQDHSQRLGSATFNGEETVIGTVMLQSSYNAREVLQNVKNQITKWNSENNFAQIEILYDRQFLIDSTIKTVFKNLSEGIFLIIIVLFLLMGSFKAGLIVASSLPICIFILAIFMKIFGISANLMSLGAIDFGLLVDSSVVMIEYIIANQIVHKNSLQKNLAIAELCSQIYKPILYGIVIITLVYMPILFFEGIEGKTFKPMAINVIISMLASLFVAFFLSPILASFLLNKKSDHQDKIFNYIKNFYQFILEKLLKNSWLVIIFCGGFFVFSIHLLYKLPSDFLPDLNEGDIIFTIVADESSSLNNTQNIIQQIEKKIIQENQVDKTFSRIGIAESGMDLMPQNSGDIFIILKENSKIFAPQIAKNILTKINQQISAICQNCEISISQPIKMRFNEMLEGSRADLSLKIYGEDFNKLIEISDKIKDSLKNNSQLKNIEKDFVNSIRQGKFIDVIPNYSEIARQQITIEDFNNDLKNSMAGIRVGSYFATQFPLAIIMHLNEGNRNNIDSINKIPVSMKDGGSFSLGEVSLVKENVDITSIPRHFGKRYSGLSIYLNDTEYQKFINNSNQIINQEKILPKGYSIEWGGRFENLNLAKKQIFITIPFIFLIIGILLFSMFKKLTKVFIIFTSVPFAISGGIVFLSIFKIPLTISVYVGFIALIGISLLNSIILINTYRTTRDLILSCKSRLRPILMTAMVASIGFVPMAIGKGIGAEVQQPIAVVIIGGIITSCLATLILQPILLKKFLDYGEKK